MRSMLAALFSVALLCGAALTQQTPPPNPDTQTPRSDEQPNQPTQQGESSAQTAANQKQSSSSLKIAPGSVIPVQLTKTIDAKKAKTGDEVVAKVTQDMKTNSGDVLVPKDTKIIGHVTEAQPHSKEQKESQMAIAFDHAVMKDGDQVNLPMSIQAIIGTQQNNAANAGGTDQGGPAPSSAGGGQPAVGAGAARPGMNAGGSTPSPSASPTAGDNTAPASTGTANGGMPPITGQT